MDLRQKDVLVGKHIMEFDEIVAGSVDYYVDRFGTLPRYSSEIAAAMQMAQKMRERGWNFTLNWNDDLPEAIFFKGWPIEDTTAIAVRCNQNPATAIIDAALAAEGVEVRVGEC